MELNIRITASPVYPSDNLSLALNDQLIALVTDSDVLGPEDMTIAFLIAQNDVVIEQRTVKQGVYSAPPSFIGKPITELAAWATYDSTNAYPGTTINSIYVVNSQKPKSL